MNIAFLGGTGHYGYAIEGLSLRSDLQVVGVAPGSEGEKLTGLLNRLETLGCSPRLYENPAALLAAEKVDVAVIAPWFCDTAKTAILALQHGAHVYCEKPLATELPDLDALEDAWKASGCALGGMFGIRHSAWFQTMEKAIQDGCIGEVRQLHGQKSYKLGKRDMPYRKRAAYGGMIPWVGIHAMDWVLHLGGACRWVSAAQSDYANQGHDELEMSSAVLMSMENGVIGTVTADYLRPVGAARHDDDRLRVTGTRGMLESIDHRVYLEDEQPRRELPLLPAQPTFLLFLDSIGTPEAEKNALEALAVTRVSLLARQSGDEGRTIFC